MLGKMSTVCRTCGSGIEWASTALEMCTVAANSFLTMTLWYDSFVCMYESEINPWTAHIKKGKNSFFKAWDRNSPLHLTCSQEKIRRGKWATEVWVSPGFQAVAREAGDSGRNWEDFTGSSSMKKTSVQVSKAIARFEKWLLWND